MEKSLQRKAELYNITLLIALFLFRTVVPFLKYPFIVLFIYSLFYIVFVYKSQVFKEVSNFIRNYVWVSILIIILFLAFILSDKLYLVVFKDLVDVIILFNLFFLCSIIIQNVEDTLDLVQNIINIIILFAVLISITGLLNLFEIFKFNDLFDFSDTVSLVAKDTATIDPNFALLPLFFGIIGVFYLLISSKKSKLQLLYYSILGLYTLQIVFSGSRRGLIILICLVILIIGMQFFRISQTYTIFKQIASSSVYYIYFIFTCLILCFLFVSNSSCSFRLKLLKAIGSKNIVLAKENITQKLYRYNGIITEECDYESLYSKIWTPRYNPIDPDCGWGNRTHKTIFPLIGDNVEIVPKDVKGYYMDSTCEAGTWLGHAFSYTPYEKKMVYDADRIYATVYCYVSKDFSGDWARLSFDGATKGEIKGGFDYDMTKLGTWQKLSANIECSEGTIITYMYFCKKDVKDFSTLKGFVIFAYPQIHVETKNISVSSASILGNAYDSSNMRVINVKKRLEVLSYTSTIKNDIILEKGVPVSSYTSLSFFNKDKYNYSCLFSIFKPLSANLIQISVDEDPIRKWVRKLISEDSTYSRMQTTVSIDSIKNRFSDLRSTRWKFAFEVFSEEYTIRQKLFGGGFNFLNWYGYYFLKDKTASDWPHNPFLSILLYSGILGLLVYCFFLYKVFYYYIKYIKEYPLLFIFFLITFFFSFFSGGSPFDPPIMGFFSILPFFIHSVHKRDESQKQPDNLD